MQKYFIFSARLLIKFTYNYTYTCVHAHTYKYMCTYTHTNTHIHTNACIPYIDITKNNRIVINMEWRTVEDEIRTIKRIDWMSGTCLSHTHNVQSGT